MIIFQNLFRSQSGNLLTTSNQVIKFQYSGGPGISLTLCCFMVYSARRFVSCLTLCYFVLVFSVPLALRLPHLGKRELILVLFVRLFDLRLFGFICFLFS